MARLKCNIEGCDNNRKGFGYCNRHYKKLKLYGDPTYSAFNLTPSQRFWAFVDQSAACWLWTGSLNNKGYGNFKLQGRAVLSHRFAYEDQIGPIPSGMVIDHVCHVPACCNPRHLRLATQKQNCENLLGAQRASRTGHRGVERLKNGSYHARVRHNGVRYSAGTFSTLEEAAEAARQLRLSLYTHNDADRRIA